MILSTVILANLISEMATIYRKVKLPKSFYQMMIIKVTIIEIQQRRSFRDVKETPYQGDSLLFTNSSKGSFNCRSTIDSLPQRRTFI